MPGHVVVIDQFIDRTKNRASTFFEKAWWLQPSGPVCTTPENTRDGGGSDRSNRS